MRLTHVSLAHVTLVRIYVFSAAKNIVSGNPGCKVPGLRGAPITVSELAMAPKPWMSASIAGKRGDCNRYQGPLSLNCDYSACYVTDW